MAGPIPAAAFYGHSSRQPDAVSAQLEVSAGRLQRASVCRLPRPSLLGPAVTWQVFPRQAEALRAAAARPGLRLMVFGCEERVPGGGGRRSYLVCHPSVFWQCDEQKKPDERCSYEVIRQGTPCKVYLDLEFDRTLNPDRDGDAMVETLISVITTVVDHLFGVKCARSEVIDLCASSEKKFSRHLILCCSDLVFSDNITVGNLVRDICDAIRSFVLRDETEDLTRLGLQRFGKYELSQLLVNSCNEKNNLFCDEGVYTKNRNFRVYKSSKFGKRRPLTKSAHNTYSPEIKPNRTNRDHSPEEAFFLASLVSHIEGSTRPLKYGTPPCQGDVPISSIVQGRHSSRPHSVGPSASPYPDIDAFVRELVSPGGIRCWNYFDASELLVYDIVGFRFCHNIGRWHRSNNILIVVSLRESSFYQKCHDPVCRGFRSSSVQLPSRLLAWRELGDDWEAEGGGGMSDEQFLDCGASDTEMLSAAALAEPASNCVSKQYAGLPGTRRATDVEHGRPKTLAEAADTEHGVSCNGVANIEQDSTPMLAMSTPPDLFPDCGMEDGELAAVPTGTCIAQHSCDGRAPGPPAADPLPKCDDSFPDCGVEDGEMLAEVYTESLSNCGAQSGDDQSKEPVEMLPNPGADSFPDCGVGDAELPAVPCTGSQWRSPTDATGRGRSGSPVEFPDCGVGDWELSDPAESPGREQDLFPDWGLAGGSPEPPDLFPDCGVGDWELCEVGRPACAAAVPANTPASASPADTATDHTAHTPGTGSESDQPYFTAKTASFGSDVWEDLTETDISDLRF